MSAHPYDTLIRNGIVVTPGGEVAADIAIAGGRIAALLAPGGQGAAAETFDAAGCHILPGAIDIHVHVRAPAFPERATVESETRAAAAGGVTTLFEMPLSKPCCSSAAQVRLRRAHFADRAIVNFALYAAPGDLSADTIDAMVDEGIIAFKIFTTPAPPNRSDEFDGLAFPDEADQMAALLQAARVGLPIVVHAESADLLAYYGAQAASLDPAAAGTHGQSRPDVVEAVAVAKLLAMNIKARARLHIAHVTSAATVDILRRFAGTSDFSAETCPHYLLRTESDVERVGVFGKVNPPVRSQADQDALWAALADGTIAHVTTDHAAFSLAEKQAALGNFPAAPPGTPGIEQLVPALLDAAAQGRLPLSRVTALLSTNAARRFGLPGKGAIQAGADADLMVVDLQATTTVSPAGLFTQARDVSQLYAGMRFSAQVRQTFVAGCPAFDRGTICGRPGMGGFTRPSTSNAASPNPAAEACR